MRKLHFSPLASAVGAFAFTFPMPVIAKHGHAQLLYRFLIPVGVLCWQRFSETSRWRWIGWLALVVVGQFYISIYLGYFMLLLLAAWAIVQWRLEGWGPSGWFRQWGSWREPSDRQDLIVAMCMLFLACIAFVVLMHPYLHYAKTYGFSRGAAEIATMLPRPQSYLLADESRIWGGLTANYFTVPMRGEHQMFFGLGIIGLALVGVFRSARRQRWLALVSVVLLVVLTLSVQGYSLYLLLAKLPGVNSIRAVSRISLVFTFPIALLVAMGVDAVRGATPMWRVLVVFLGVAMVTESVATHTVHFDSSQAREQTKQMVTQLPSPLPEKAILFNPSQADEPFFVTELDGMVLGQELNRPTLNGYSGNLAPGYEPHSQDYPCVQAAARIEAAKLFYAQHLKRRLPLGAAGPIIIVGNASCAETEAWRKMPLTDAGKVSLRIESVQRRGDHYEVQVDVRNDSAYALNTSTSRAQPLFLSWQKVSEGRTVDSKAWVARIEVGGHGSLLPGEQRSVSFSVPVAAGDGRALAVNAVLEGRAWLSDYGLKPAFGSLSTEK